MASPERRQPHLTVAYQVEPFTDLLEELPALFHAHWRRIALDQERVPLAPRWEMYKLLADAGVLHCITVREHQQLIGYYFFQTQPHLHYANSLTAFTDIYYIRPGANLFVLYGRYRRLFQAAEAEMRRLHVQKAYTEVKLHSDFLGKLFVRLGWRPAATSYTKVLE